MHLYSDKRPTGYLSWFLKGLLVMAVLILFGRLTELTIIKGEYYRTLAEDNRIRHVTITAPRGKVLDRYGVALADNEEIRKTVIFEPTEGYSKVTPPDGTPEDEVIYEWRRFYPYASESAHLVGYLGEIDAEEFGKADPKCLSKGPRTLGALIGRSGLEAQYECRLRGSNGEELVEVDIAGHKIRTVGRKPPLPGEDIKTTIDSKLQAVVSKSLEGVSGAAVLTDGRGQVLALSSAPSFNPDIFFRSDMTDEIQKTFTDVNLPLFNRALSGTYHPGSIFKLVTGTAGLESGEITTDFRYNDTGAITINNFSYTTWYFTQYGQTEGEIDITRALARSTDTFFYKVGEMIGPNLLAAWADKFGVGKLTNIDLPGEVTGLLATPEWKQNVKGERWFLGNTYHMSIGQGDLTTTPLQGNILSSVIANGGLWCRPHIEQSLQSECIDLHISKPTIAVIKKGMMQACQTGGTAFPFFDFSIPVACKTGTAETGEGDTTHAWFTIFAPADNPEVVLTILVEKGGEGSRVAAPIARKILDYWASTQ